MSPQGTGLNLERFRQPADGLQIDTGRLAGEDVARGLDVDPGFGGELPGIPALTLGELINAPLDRHWEHPTAQGKMLMGWLEGFEPSTARSTIWCSAMLSYSHHGAGGEPR